MDQGLIDFLIGSYMTSGESKRELADREEAITGINPLSPGCLTRTGNLELLLPINKAP